VGHRVAETGWHVPFLEALGPEEEQKTRAGDVSVEEWHLSKDGIAFGGKQCLML